MLTKPQLLAVALLAIGLLIALINAGSQRQSGRVALICLIVVVMFVFNQVGLMGPVIVLAWPGGY